MLSRKRIEESKKLGIVYALKTQEEPIDDDKQPPELAPKVK